MAISRPKPRFENVHVLHNRLDKYANEISRLEATVKAQKALLGTSADPLLIELAEALQLAALASDPRTSPTLESGSRSAETPMPGDNVKGARRAHRQLRRKVEEAIQQFGRAADHQWYPPRIPHPDDDVPSVRCCQRDCPAQDVTEKAWRTIRGGRRIYRERCGSCGSTMVAADNPQQQQLHGVS